MPSKESSLPPSAQARADQRSTARQRTLALKVSTEAMLKSQMLALRIPGINTVALLAQATQALDALLLGWDAAPLPVSSQKVQAHVLDAALLLTIRSGLQGDEVLLKLIGDASSLMESFAQLATVQPDAGTP